MKNSEFILIKTSIFLFYMSDIRVNFEFGRCRKTPSVSIPEKTLFLYLNFLGGSKKVVATFDVRKKKLNIYNDSFEWEGKNQLFSKLNKSSCIKCGNEGPDYYKSQVIDYHRPYRLIYYNRILTGSHVEAKRFQTLSMLVWFIVTFVRIVAYFFPLTRPSFLWETLLWMASL